MAGVMQQHLLAAESVLCPRQCSLDLKKGDPKKTSQFPLQGNNSTLALLIRVAKFIQHTHAREKNGSSNQ